MSMMGEAPAIWLGPRTAWVIDSADLLTVCTSSRCAPIASHDSCAIPQCPGAGHILTVASDVATVGGWPGDYGGFTREREQLVADARLASIVAYLGQHPDYYRIEEARQNAERANEHETARHQESVRWVSEYRDHDRWELGGGAMLATLGSSGGVYFGPSASVALVHLLSRNQSDEHDEDATIMNIFLGDTFGAELRTRVLFDVGAMQSQVPWIVSVGVSPVLENRYERTVARIPSFFGTIVPEIGAIFRNDRTVTWYVTWDAPVSVLVDHDVAIDIRGELTLIDDWLRKPPDRPEASEPVEVLAAFYFGVRSP